MMDGLKLEAPEALQACRVCLATDIPLYGILEHRLDAAYVEIMGTMFSAWDGLPQHVCGICRRLLVRSAEFRNRGLRAQHHLKQCLDQHFLTTDFIRSVDRVSLDLALAWTVATPREPVACCHKDLVKVEVPVEIDYKEDIPLDGDSVSVKFEENDDSNDDIALSELQDKPKRKRKIVRKQKPQKLRDRKVKTEKKEKPRGGPALKIRDEDFPAFEKEYNIDVVIRTREQQLEDMAARKLRDNYMNSPFKCEKCFKGFFSEATLGNHNVKHHDESVGAHLCELCGCRFRIPAILRRHAETHRLRFVCQHCGFTARDRSHAMTHSKEHKGLRYECQYCGDSFKKRSTYGTHVRIQHPNENKSCDICGETFIGALGLALHKKKSHREPQAETNAACCKLCGVLFESARALARHFDTAGDTCRDYRACSLCGANFKDDKTLQEHIRERHQSRETQCQECDMTFATVASLDVHFERVHLKKKIRRKLPKSERRYDRYLDQFMCDMCGKKCQNNIALKYHIRSHTGEKPHACPHCPKHYSTPVALQYHIRSHTGDKPLACPHCPLRYATHKGLQTHLLKHTGERPFKCELCGKAFTQKTMLQKHKTSHLFKHTGERPFKCDLCGKAFPQKTILLKHKTVHTGEKPFSCDICGKTFSQSGAVHTHVKYVHKKMPAPPRNRGRRDRLEAAL